jgi:hypothetical protein
MVRVAERLYKNPLPPCGGGLEWGGVLNDLDRQCVAWMERSETQEPPGFRPDGLHPGYGVFIQCVTRNPDREGRS